ncbi:MAG: RdgB/HAM1 family non-canonical purine NTP pyrophosphatase [Actinomycetota bacterium]|nr:RdgB/HAM1 family non-canonical purine NTP pyrophosphatase [Actinomycetota bacterium]
MSSNSDTTVKRVVVATSNRHKVEEIAAALAYTGWSFVAASNLCGWESPPETGETFEENALIKAHAAHDLFGMPTLADDSGLEVDALDGAPGVHSSRYAGECATDALNNERLLTALFGIPAKDRTARFRSVIAFVDGDGEPVLASGACEGRVAEAPRGDLGFGYDPLFLPDAAPGRTMAELEMSEKNAISHRGAALRAFVAALEAATTRGAEETA